MSGAHAGRRPTWVAGAAGGIVAATALFFAPSLPDFAAAKARLAALLLVPFLACFFVWPALRRGVGPAPPFGGPFLFLLAAFALSSLGAHDLHAAGAATFSLAGSLLFAASLRGTEEKGRRAFLTIVFAAACLVAAYGLLQRFGLDFDRVRRVYDSRRFPVSTFGYTGGATEFVAPCAVAALAAVLGGGAPRAPAAACAALGSLYIGAAGARAGMVTLVLAAGFVLFRARTRRSTAAVGASVLLLAAGLVIPRPRTPVPSPTGAVPAAAASIPPSFEVRARIYRSTARMALDHPLLGIGPGNFAAAFPPYRDPEEAWISSHGFTERFEAGVETAHDDPLQIASETGLLGAVALFLLAFAVGRACLRTETPAGMAAAAGVLAIAVNSLFRSPLLENPPTLLLFFGFLAFLAPPVAPRSASNGWKVLGLLSLPPLAFAILESARGLCAQFHLAAYFRSGEEDRVALQSAVRLEPRNALALAVLGKSLLGEPDRALPIVDRALELRPSDPALRMNRGIAVALKGRLDEAEAEFLRARELSPRDPRPLFNLALLHARRGEKERAAAVLRAYLVERPEEREKILSHPDLGPLVPP